MTHSMFMAIISFIIFAAIAGGAGYVFYQKSDIKADFEDTFGSHKDR